MWGESCTAISAAATGSTSPVSAPPSILRRGWKKSPVGLVAPSSHRRDLPGCLQGVGPIWASFPSPVFQRLSASTACRVKRPRRETATFAAFLLFLRLGGEQQRRALGAARVGGPRRLVLGALRVAAS